MKRVFFLLALVLTGSVFADHDVDFAALRKMGEAYLTDMEILKIVADAKAQKTLAGSIGGVSNVYSVIVKTSIDRKDVEGARRGFGFHLRFHHNKGLLETFRRIDSPPKALKRSWDIMCGELQNFEAELFEGEPGGDRIECE